MYRYRFLLLFLLLSPLVSAGQGTALERLLERFANRSWVQAGGKLFLHTDKTLYTNNETVWFAGYLSSGAAVPLGAHHTLSVALQHLESGAVVHSELYVMDSGLSSGSMLLPDSIPGGSYRLLAYTNVVGRDGMPVEFFEQPLTIKSTLEAKFSASVLLLDTASSFKGPRRISVRASGLPIDRKGNYAPAAVRYRIGGGAEATALTDGQGAVSLSYDPDTLGGMRSISASVSHGGETRHLVLALPATELRAVRAGFYPEGGHIVAGLEGRVGFELRSASGRALAMRAELLRDGVPVDTVETGVSGMGSFLLRPQAGSVYALKAHRGSLLDRDTLLALPGATEGLPLIAMENALAGDTLDFTLSAPRMGSYRVLLHNTRELLASFDVDAGPGGRKVRVALKGVPKGLAAVTVLDTLGVPLAERLFLAHYGGEDLVGASTDKAAYGTREKVTLKLRLQAGAMGRALVSVAAVQGNRIETGKFRDMESWSYLESELGALPPSAGGLPYRDRDYLESLLLIKGWRRFVWEPAKWPASADTVALYRSLELGGRVLRFNKELKKQLDVSLLRDTVFEVITTDEVGVLKFTSDQLVINAQKRLLFTINEPDKENYTIIFDDPYQLTTQHLIKNDDALSQSIVRNIDATNFNTLPKLAGNAIQLKQVVIKGDKDSILMGVGFGKTHNKCGDWVCVQGYLNCPVRGHGPTAEHSRPPIKGSMYRVQNPTSSSNTSYLGCVLENVRYVYRLSGIQYAKEFYVNDYKADPSESYQSTVFWSPFVQLGSDGDTELSFYTSDLKAPYRIVVQGLGEGQVVTGGAAFKVE